MTVDIALTGSEYRGLLAGRFAVPVDDAVFRLSGPGTIACVQGVLTNDVAAAGTDALVWGAALTPKGMIIADLWVRREDADVVLLAPAVARDTVRELLARSFPPRLTRTTDVTGQVAVRWLLGGVPPALDGADVVRPAGAAPFAALALTPDPAAADARLAAAGWIPAPARYADAARLLAGWPTLGREIDARTLPQEVRFDELGGVRYDKGCYTGQETVARLHFRGHTNRSLRGLHFTAGAAPQQREVSHDGRPAGTIGTIGQIGEVVVALATLRREVATGTDVDVGDAAATVVELPFDPALFAMH